MASSALGDSARAQRWIDRIRESGDSPGLVGLALAAIGETEAAYPSVRQEDPLYRELIRMINQQWGRNPDGRRLG